MTVIVQQPKDSNGNPQPMVYDSDTGKVIVDSEGYILNGSNRVLAGIPSLLGFIDTPKTQTSGIQEAYDYSNSIFIKNGTYILNAPIQISHAIKIEGESININPFTSDYISGVQIVGASNSDILQITEPVNGFTLKNVLLTYNSTTTGSAINTTSNSPRMCINSYLDQVYITNSSAGNYAINAVNWMFGDWGQVFVLGLNGVVRFYEDDDTNNYGNINIGRLQATALNITASTHQSGENFFSFGQLNLYPTTSTDYGLVINSSNNIFIGLLDLETLSSGANGMELEGVQNMQIGVAIIVTNPIVVFNNGSYGNTLGIIINVGSYGWDISGTALSNPNGVILNYNGVGGLPAISTPSVPASGTAQSNSNPYPVKVYVNGGAITEIQITIGSNTYTVYSNSTASAVYEGFTLPAGASITLTYTTAPTWSWVPE